MNVKAMAVVILVVIMAIAAFFLMKGEEPAPVTPPETDIATVISEGKPISCLLTIDLSTLTSNPNYEGVTATSDIKAEGVKMRVEGSTMGFPFTVISNGERVYLNVPVLGDGWYDIGANVTMATIASPQEIRETMGRLREGITLDCQVTGDIPDSEFELPVGVVVKSFDELAGLVNTSILG